MKRTKPMLLAAALGCLAALALFSCSNGLLKDPRLYNAKKDAGGGALAVAPEPELDLTGGVDVFDKTDEWYNKEDSNGDGETPNKLDFPAKEFEQMSLVGTYFDGSNVPVYAMKKENVWLPEDTAKAEFVHANAPDTTGQGYGISEVHWYQYRGRNPLYAPDGSYNNQLLFTAEGNPKLSRFYFYRFTGETLSPSLDNFLFAVDTYSKLMFAFAKPTKMESVLGNQVPKAWGPTDGEKFLGTSYQFYMYDPVGYVLKEGDGSYKVEMYDWFKKNLAKGVYEPTLGGLDRNSQGTPLDKVATKKLDGAGKSPFNNHTADFFVENMKLLKDKAFVYRPAEGEHQNGSWLHTVSTADGSSFTEQKTQYGTEKKEDGRKFTYKSSLSATEGLFTDASDGEWTVTLQDSSSKISFVKNDGSDQFTVSIGGDPGPAWLIRVKGKVFSGSGYTYTFTEDGKTIRLSNGKTYTYAKQDANDRAVYREGSLVFWGVKISENDTKITWTPTSWASAGTTPSSLANSSPAWLSVEVPDDPKFYDYVKAGTYSYREEDGYTGTDGKGYGLTLHSWTFDSTGKTATPSSTLWRNVQKDDSPLSYSSETDTSTATYGDKTFSLSDDGHTLTVDGKRYYRNFNDPGPSFENRVKDNPRFSTGENSYEFQNSGKNLVMNGTTYTLERYESDNRARAVYWNRTYVLFGYVYSFYGVELSDNDGTIKMTSLSTKDEIMWVTLGWEAKRTTQ